MSLSENRQPPQWIIIFTNFHDGDGGDLSNQAALSAPGLVKCLSERAIEAGEIPTRLGGLEG